jgi:photosystem II stability/assembly factor-like uncharacterized protein
VLNPASPDTLYAGTLGDGVFKTMNGGQSWNASNSGITAKDIRAIARDPSTLSTLYAASSAGGLFKSIDGGNAWIALDNGVPQASRSFDTFFSIAIDPSNPNTLYAGCYLCLLSNFTYSGIFKSSDGGQSWSVVNSDGAIVAIAPSNPSTLYAGSFNNNGLLKSTDAGQSWTDLGPLGTLVLSVAIDPLNPNLVYTGAFYHIDASSFFAVAIDPITSSTIYWGTAAGTFWKSTDGGMSSSAISQVRDSLGQAVGVRGIAIDPTSPSTLFVGTFGAGVFKSIDAGQSWSNMSVGLKNLFVDTVVIDPGNARNVVGK